MKNTRKGFTLVELVIVIAVIAILAAVLIPTFGGIIEKANASKAYQEARNEYTMYVSEKATTNAVNPNLVIVVDGYYVQVQNGKLDSGATKGTFADLAEYNQVNTTNAPETLFDDTKIYEKK